MNMKSLLKELVKDPQIKALYNEGFDRSLINKLIIESLMEQDEEIEIPDNDKIDKMSEEEKQKLKSQLEKFRSEKSQSLDGKTRRKIFNALKRMELGKASSDYIAKKLAQQKSSQPEAEISNNDDKTELDIPPFRSEMHDAIRKQNTPDQVKTMAKNIVQNIKKDESVNDEQKEEAIKDIYQLAQEKLKELAGVEESEEITLEKVKEYIETKEWKTIETYFNNIKKWFDKNPDKNEILFKDYKTAAEERIIFESESDSGEYDVKLLTQIIDSIKLFFQSGPDAALSRKGFMITYELLQNLKEQVKKLTALVVKDKIKEPEANADIQRIVQNTNQKAQKLLNPPKEDEKTGELTTTGEEPTSDDAEEKVKDQKPKYIARESFLKKWTPVGEAFDNYEEFFDTTPFLKIQSQVLFSLKDALQEFVDDLEEASKSTGKKEEAPEKVQEQAGEVIQVQPEEQKKIFSLHKELIKETNALVKIIKQLNDENMTTIGGSNIRKRARLKAKNLMNLMTKAFVELDAIEGEEKEKLTFKEQQEMDEETELLRKSHQQILSNMTKMDRIARARPKEDEDTRIDSKYITPVVKSTLAIIDGIEHMFPKSSPFGKKGNLGEIKIQVKGIARDIIDIVAKLKDFAKSDKTRAQNVDKLKEYILNAMATISNSFDIDIEDEEMKSLLPKKARPNAPSFNKGAAELKEKLDQLMQKYGPKVKEAFEKAKDKEGVLSKIIKFVEKATSKITKDKTVTPEIIKQTLEGVAGFEEEMLKNLEQPEDIPSFERFQQLTFKEKIDSLSPGLGEATSAEGIAKVIYKVIYGKDPEQSVVQRIKSFFKENIEQDEYRDFWYHPESKFYKELLAWFDINLNTYSDVLEKVKRYLEDIRRVYFTDDEYSTEKTKKFNKKMEDDTEFIKFLSNYFKDYPKTYVEPEQDDDDDFNLEDDELEQEDDDFNLEDEDGEETEEVEQEVETAVKDAVEEEGVGADEEIDNETKKEIVNKVVNKPELKDKAEETGVSEEDLFDLVKKELDNLIDKNEESGEFDLKDAKDLLDTEIVKILLSNEELNKIIEDFGPIPAIDASSEDKDKFAEKYTEEVHNKLSEIFRIAKENKRNANELKRFKGFLRDFKYGLSKEYNKMHNYDRYRNIRDLINAHGVIKDLNQAYKQGNEEKVKDNFKDLQDLFDNKPEDYEDFTPKSGETDDSAAKEDYTYTEAIENGYKPSPMTIIKCPECNTKFRFVMPERRLAKPTKKMKMRCLICASQFSVRPIKLDYQFEKEDEDKIFIKGKDIVNSTGSLKVLTDTKKEQIERKLERIIEHYLNTGKL